MMKVTKHPTCTATYEDDSIPAVKTANSLKVLEAGNGAYDANEHGEQHLLQLMVDNPCLVGMMLKRDPQGKQEIVFFHQVVKPGDKHYTILGTEQGSKSIISIDSRLMAKSSNTKETTTSTLTDLLQAKSKKDVMELLPSAKDVCTPRQVVILPPRAAARVTELNMEEHYAAEFSVELAKEFTKWLSDLGDEED